MSITEDTLRSILDASLKTLEEKLIASYAEDLRKTHNLITASLDSIKKTASSALNKAKANETSISALSDRVDTLVQSSDAHSNVISSLQDEVAILKETNSASIDKIKQLDLVIAKANEDVEDVRNRQMRKTLVFKNIPESEEEKKNGWAGAEKALVDTMLATDMNLDEDQAYDLIERCHRGARAQNRQNHPRDIICQFHTWKDSQLTLTAFAKKNASDRNFKKFCNQKYGPLTNARRNMAMVERKRLLEKGDIAKGYVAYPAKLFTAANKRDSNYKLQKDFSRAEVPMIIYPASLKDRQPAKDD